MTEEAPHFVPSWPGLSWISNHFGPRRRRSVVKSKPSFFCNQNCRFQHTDNSSQSLACSSKALVGQQHGQLSKA